MDWAAIPFTSIKQDSFPFLVLSGEYSVLPWNYGRLFLQRLSANYVRVTPRGVQFSTMTTMNEQAVSAAVWNTHACAPTAHALCRVDRGLVLFPDTVVDVPYDFSQIPSNAFLTEFPTGACTSPSSARIVNLSDTQYEVSLCDLMDANLDVVFDTRSDMVYWRMDRTSALEYVGVSIASVYFISCISVNVVRLARGDTLALTAVDNSMLVGLILYVLVGLIWDKGGLQPLITAHDVGLAWMLLAYVCLELVVISSPRITAALHLKHTDTKIISGVSLYTTAVMLLAMRVHYTFDNPYTSVLAVMFGTRSFVKLFAMRKLGLSTLAVACDMAVFCGVLWVGTGLSASSEFEGCLMQQTVVVASLLLAVAFDAKGREREPANKNDAQDPGHNNQRV